MSFFRLSCLTSDSEVSVHKISMYSYVTFCGESLGGQIVTLSRTFCEIRVNKVLSLSVIEGSKPVPEIPEAVYYTIQGRSPRKGIVNSWGELSVIVNWNFNHCSSVNRFAEDTDTHTAGIGILQAAVAVLRIPSSVALWFLRHLGYKFS